METRAWVRRWCSGEPAQWQSLPPEILCRVFQHLADRERCAARLACRQWDQVFRMPQLWRERHFRIRGLDETEGLRAARYMETLGTHLRHMEVEVGMPIVQNARLISLAVETLLNARPRGLRLQTLSITGLEFFQTPLYRIARHRVRMVRALCGLLRRQKWLEHVNLACCQMGRDDGARLLKALSHYSRPYTNQKASAKRKAQQENTTRDSEDNHTQHEDVETDQEILSTQAEKVSNKGQAESNKSLVSLELRDFFLEDVNVGELLAFKEEMGRFSALRHVGLNFTYLNDAVLARLTECAAKTLETLSLGVDGSHLLLVAHMTFNNLTVTTAGWRKATLNCPRLRVLMDMRGRFRLIDFQRVLIPGIPLACLSITSLIASLFFGSEDMMAHIARLLDYLTHHFSYTLTTFHLSWSESSTVWPHRDVLVRLVNASPSLSCLSLTMALPLDTVLDISAATSKHPCAEPLHLHISGVDETAALSSMHVQTDRSKCIVHTCKGNFCL